jgi:hypothetical protein
MTDRATAAPLACQAARALPGTWKLPARRAVTLRPVSDGILRVADGRLWATREGPHGRTPEDSGDHVLELGRSMLVRAGERVVLEAWSRGGASFAWDPLPAGAACAHPAAAALRQPLAELRTALLMVLDALGSLACGLGRLAWRAIPGRRSRAPAGRRPHAAA